MPAAASPESVQTRLSELESHLEQENPILLSAVQSFRSMDRVAYDMGLLPQNESFANQIPWWPLISILGTFSAGKSTFINDFAGQTLQRTGNQAVDDRFTVIVYSPESKGRALPGISLDSDPRFPFYKMSQQIEQAEGGQGKRIDAYLQLKTCRSDRLRGKIIIDSPGFDADAQRTAILSITDHMIDLSDLVLVFFDARHPEPGAMRDTLQHLVVSTMERADASKFLYILNQMDTSSREDNPEDVVAAWLRALGEVGMTTGRFYTTFSKSAPPIEDPVRRERFEKKRDRDLEEIYERMEQVEVERAYRIVGALRKAANEFGDETVPLLETAVKRWRSRTLTTDLIAFLLLLVGFFYWSISSGHWTGLSYDPDWLKQLEELGITYAFEIGIALALAGAFVAHLWIRRLAALSVTPWLRKQITDEKIQGDVVGAFQNNWRSWRTLFTGRPLGWNAWNKGRISKVLHDCEAYVQQLNERFTNPKGLEG